MAGSNRRRPSCSLLTNYLPVRVSHPSLVLSAASIFPFPLPAEFPTSTTVVAGFGSAFCDREGKTSPVSREPAPLAVPCPGSCTCSSRRSYMFHAEHCDRSLLSQASRLSFLSSLYTLCNSTGQPSRLPSFRVQSLVNVLLFHRDPRCRPRTGASSGPRTHFRIPYRMQLLQPQRKRSVACQSGHNTCAHIASCSAQWRRKSIKTVRLCTA
jgi:hypothetical protein